MVCKNLDRKIYILLKNSLEKVVKSEYTIIKGVDFVMLKRKIEQKLIDWKNAKEFNPDEEW